MSHNAFDCDALTGTKAAAPEPKVQTEVRRVPQSLEEVDNGQILGFGADLAEDHPGFKDQAYKDRRMAIADIARAHRVYVPVVLHSFYAAPSGLPQKLTCLLCLTVGIPFRGWSTHQRRCMSGTQYCGSFVVSIRMGLVQSFSAAFRYLTSRRMW